MTTSPPRERLATGASDAEAFAKPSPKASAKPSAKLRIPDALPLVRRRSWKLRLLGLLLSPLLLSGGFFLYLDFQTERVDALGDYAGRPADSPGVNWLIVGSDSREGLSKEERAKYNTGGGDGKRTDSMMLLHIGSQNTTLISLPRDSYVAIPGHGSNKLNTAFTLGGSRLLSRTIEKATGVRIDHYAEVGFEGFVGIVDAVGGVRRCIKQPVQDKKAGLDLKAGCQTLNGEQALAYIRARKAFAGGDFDRVKNQQAFLAALMQKATTNEVLTNPVRAVPLSLRAANTLTVTSGDHLWDLPEFAWAMGDVTGGNGRAMTVPVAGSGFAPGVGKYVKWDPARAAAVFKALREDRVNPPAPAPAKTTAPVERVPAQRESSAQQGLKGGGGEAGQELIENGTFTGAIAPWTADDTFPEEVNNQLRVETVSGVSEDLTAGDVDSNAFPLRTGRTYELNFDAAADSEVDIAVSVQPSDRFNAEVLREVSLTPAARRFKHTFTVDENSPEAIVSFELAGHFITNEVRIDNVSLREKAT
jgi:LCP family protein required for cell wall assembly